MKTKHEKELLKNYKIRKWLNGRYHLTINYSIENGVFGVKKWELFKIYPGWLEDNSKPIMTDETHTYKELFKFAKKHRKYNSTTESISLTIIAGINVVLCFSNFLFNSDILRGYVNGVNTVIIYISFVKMFILYHNEKIEKLEARGLIK